MSAMEDMLEKAEAQRSDGQKAEMEANHNFEMLKQSLSDAIKTEEGELSAAKKGKAMAEEVRAPAGNQGSTDWLHHFDVFCFLCPNGVAAESVVGELRGRG